MIAGPRPSPLACCVWRFGGAGGFACRCVDARPGGGPPKKTAVEPRPRGPAATKAEGTSIRAIAKRLGVTRTVGERLKGQEAMPEQAEAEYNPE